MLRKVISGGQTGVDRAALDVGMCLGIPVGGACPKGRRAEDGPIHAVYPLEELASKDYVDRTRKNVADADGTLILYRHTLSGGTALTKKIAEELSKPHIVIDLSKDPNIKDVQRWINDERIETLNIAGPRASTHPGIYQQASHFLKALLRK